MGSCLPTTKHTTFEYIMVNMINQLGPKRRVLSTCTTKLLMIKSRCLMLDHLEEQFLMAQDKLVRLLFKPKVSPEPTASTESQCLLEGHRQDQDTEQLLDYVETELSSLAWVKDRFTRMTKRLLRTSYIKIMESVVNDMDVLLFEHVLRDQKVRDSNIEYLKTL